MSVKEFYSLKLLFMLYYLTRLDDYIWVCMEQQNCFCTKAGWCCVHSCRSKMCYCPVLREENTMLWANLDSDTCWKGSRTFQHSSWLNNFAPLILHYYQIGPIFFVWVVNLILLCKSMVNENILACWDFFKFEPCCHSCLVNAECEYFQEQGFCLLFQ